MNLNNIGNKETKFRNSTLCILVKEDKVLLAMKKRGFGKGRWNGAGGKQKGKETIEEAATRETKEEIGVDVGSLQKVATLDFYFSENSEWNQRVTVFIVK